MYSENTNFAPNICYLIIGYRIINTRILHNNNGDIKLILRLSVVASERFVEVGCNLVYVKFKLYR